MSRATYWLGNVALGFSAIAIATGSVHAVVAAVCVGAVTLIRFVREGRR